MTSQLYYFLTHTARRLSDLSDLIVPLLPLISYIYVIGLQEITNIIFASGLTGLSDFFQIPIKTDFSYLQICKNLDDVKKIINNYNKYSMLSEFHSDNVYGKIYLNLSPKIATKIFNLLTDDYSKYTKSHEYFYFKSALQELCSIFTGATLTGLSFLLKSVKIQMSSSIINTDIISVNLFKGEDTIIILKLTNDINEPNLIDAYLILEPKSTKNMLQTIGL